MKCIRKILNKPKRYKYVESPAIPTKQAIPNSLDLAKTGNRFKGRRNLIIENFTLEGGELSAFFDGCENITIRNCMFKDIKSRNGHALLFYRCKNVHIYDCQFSGEFGNSEAVAINTGCTGFEVYRNLFFDIDNLPLDVIAGERDNAYTGDVRIYNNSFKNCGYRNDYWTAAGPYADGPSNVVIEDNYIHCGNKDGVPSALGIEIGAENDRTAENIMVCNNTIIGARKYGIIYGSYKKSMGGVKNVTFKGNTLTDCNKNYKEQYNAKGVAIS